MFNFFNLLKGSAMNKLESGVQKIVISLLQDVEKNHLELARLVTMGRVGDERLEEINQDILRACKMLHPLFDVAHSFVPENMTYLHKTLDWCQEIYHQVIEPNLK
mgnify:CR=1 FL=1